MDGNWANTCVDAAIWLVAFAYLWNDPSINGMIVGTVIYLALFGAKHVLLRRQTG